MVIAPINVALNYFLVWGPAPIRLGFIGAPLASALRYNRTTRTLLIAALIPITPS